MGPCCQSGAAHIADCLPLFYSRACNNTSGNLRHVQITRCVGAVVANLHIVTIVCRIPRLFHNSVTYTTYGRACWRCKVGTKMRTKNFCYQSGT